MTLILGDNIFYGGDTFQRAFAEFKAGATIFGYHVNDPERYGVVEFDADGPRDLHRGETEAAQEQLRRARPLPLRQRGGGRSRRR